MKGLNHRQGENIRGRGAIAIPRREQNRNQETSETVQNNETVK